jgi:hypothetical protein
VKVFGGIRIPQVATGKNIVLPSYISPAVSETYVPIVNDIVADIDLSLNLNLVAELNEYSLNEGNTELLNEHFDHSMRSAGSVQLTGSLMQASNATPNSSTDTSQDHGKIPVHVLMAPAVGGHSLSCVDPRYKR